MILFFVLRKLTFSNRTVARSTSVAFVAWFLAIGVAQADDSFSACLAQLKVQARVEGISDKTIQRTLDKTKHLPRVIELDRRQPEFTQTFANYFTTRINNERVQRGRELLAKHQLLLNRIQQESGIPAQYLVSFWGLETNYGGYFGEWTVTDSLATLACDTRRSGFFAQELFNALRIIESNDIAPERMVGSWAGAMGHMQFMPSTFLRYAKDIDGDGRRDLWNSVRMQWAQQRIFCVNWVGHPACIGGKKFSCRQHLIIL
jgi:membrane-bound lytic murein transglycosylase B